MGSRSIVTRSPALTVAPITRASERIGSAPVSSAKPLAIVTIRPERSVLGNGLAPHVGFPVTAHLYAAVGGTELTHLETFLAARAVRSGRPGSHHSHLCQFE